MSETAPRVFVGIDWATRAHQVCVQGVTGDVLGERSFPHDGKGLSELMDWVLQLAGGDPTTAWVAIEVPHGPVVESLLERGLRVHAINPKQLDRFRDRFTVAGAKDDRRDALVLADSLRTDTARYRRLEVDDPTVIELREWSRILQEVGQEHGRHSNRMTEQLRRYHVGFLKLPSAPSAAWLLDLWEQVPTPEAAHHVREGTIAKILKRHRIRQVTASEVLSVLREPALHVAEGTIEAATAHVQLLVERLRVLDAQRDKCHRRLDHLCERLAGPGPDDESLPGESGEQHDVTILRSLPGVGRIILAVLLAEAWRPLRQRDYQALRALCGIAPVTVQSGKHCRVRMRYACNPRLRMAVYHWARVAVMHDEAAKAHYASLRARGHSHGRALRGVADRLLAVAVSALRSGTLYDPARRRAAA